MRKPKTVGKLTWLEADEEQRAPRSVYAHNLHNAGGETSPHWKLRSDHRTLHCFSQRIGAHNVHEQRTKHQSTRNKTNRGEESANKQKSRTSTARHLVSKDRTLWPHQNPVASRPEQQGTTTITKQLVKMQYREAPKGKRDHHGNVAPRAGHAQAGRGGRTSLKETCSAL